MTQARAAMPILNQGVEPVPLCHYCTHYSFKIFYGSPTPIDYTQGKCFGWQKEDDGYRWVESHDTCERFELDYRMQAEKAKWMTPERFKHLV